MDNFNGLYIKSIRKKLELSSTEVAKAIGISPTSLSRIENCSLTCSQDIFESAVTFFEEQDPMLAFNTTDLSKDLKVKADSELKKWMTKYLENSLLNDIDEFDDLVPILSTNSLRYSFIYFEMELLEAFYSSKKSKDFTRILSLSEDLPLLSSFLSKEYMFLAYDLMGLANVYEIRNSERALEYFKKAETIIQETESSNLDAISKYHAIMALMSNMDHISALSRFDSCSLALQKANAYGRMSLMEVYRGVCLQNLGLLNEAEIIFNNIEKNVPIIDLRYIRKNAHENLMWLYLKQERYQESRRCIELARFYGSVFPDLSLASAWDSYNLDPPLECSHIIQKEITLLSKTQRSEFVKSVLILMALALEEKGSALEKQYRKVEESLPKFQNVEADYIIYSIMADYCVKSDDYKSAFAFEKKKVEYLLNRN